jgi:hypothetical protein
MCFSLAWVFQLLIWLVIIGAVVMIMRLLLPFVLGMFGVVGDLVMQVINIIIGAIIIIALLLFVLDLITCMGSFPRLTPR